MLFYLPRQNEECEDARKAVDFINSEYETKKFRQVVLKDGKLFYVKNVDPYGTACTWSPELEEEAEDLIESKTIRTLHRYGAPAFFKPSVYEAVLQLPKYEHDRDYIHAFRIECNDDSLSNWNDIEHEAMNAGFHIGYMTLYSKKGMPVRYPNGEIGHYLEPR